MRSIIRHELTVGRFDDRPAPRCSSGSGGTNRLPERLLWSLIFLGDISYSFYLLHDDIGFVMMKWLLQWGVNAYVTLVLTFAVAVAISYAMNRLVEKPGQRALRAMFKRWRERFAAHTWRPAQPKPLAGD